MSASEVIGLLTGALASPIPAVPSRYLPIILGDHEFEDHREANRVLSALMSLHNQIEGAMVAKCSFTMQGWYPETQEGLAEQVKDLRGKILWFMRGMDLMNVGSDDLLKKQKSNFGELAKMDNLLEGVERMTRRKMKGEDFNGIGDLQRQIAQMNDIASQVFMDICIATRGEMDVVH